ncbi:MAG: biotin--[acetyl-CoA-carboxylase] ligase [Methylacidiphilales bacterium]|nr:biotin--[acetyl-CoA-carboxylase] ligase [Candidatus Methylacidiphilales bacterium]
MAASVKWEIEDFDEVDSTNTLAVGRPPWSMVRARRQTSGRGRHDRVWVSGEGGLWFSLVFPVNPANPQVACLPLVVGLALYRVCGRLGVQGLRLRWPNDLLAGDLKIAGVLLERPAPDRVVIGIGLNLSNHPEQESTELKGMAAALSSLIPEAPDREKMTRSILDELGGLFQAFETAGFSSLCGEINRCWGGVRNVELEVDREKLFGEFMGIDSDGNPQLRKPDGRIQAVSGPYVWKLTEIKK